MKINYLLIFAVYLAVTFGSLRLRAEETALVFGKRVNVRGLPTMTSEVLTQLNEGETVSILAWETSPNSDQSKPVRWAKIVLPKSVPVYINANFVREGRVTSKHLNIRSGPGEHFLVLNRLAQGAKVNGSGKISGWLRIEPPVETAAYVSAEYLKRLKVTPSPSPTLASSLPTSVQIPSKPPQVISPVILEPPTAVPATSISVAPELLNDPQPAPPIGKPSTQKVVLTHSEPVIATSTSDQDEGIKPLQATPKKTDSTFYPNIQPPRMQSPVQNLNSLGLSYRIGFNTHATIKKMPPFLSGADLGTSTDRKTTRLYDDGFVGVDSSGNAGGLTWFWGYADPEQISSDRNWLHEHSYSGSVESANEIVKNSDPEQGFELFYNRQIGTFLGNSGATWGVAGALSLSDFRAQENHTVSATLNTITDSYSLGGIEPPLAPFIPCCETPGIPLIDDKPNRTTISVPNGASVIGHRNFEADIYILRLGPYVDFPMGKYVSATLSAGLVLGRIESQLGLDQTMVIPHSSVTLNQVHRSADNGISTGWYLEANLHFPLYKSIQGQIGFQYQSLGAYIHEGGFDRVELDLGNTSFLTIGMSYSF